MLASAGRGFTRSLVRKTGFDPEPGHCQLRDNETPPPIDELVTDQEPPIFLAEATTVADLRLPATLNVIVTHLSDPTAFCL
jgi:hypothetical protein